jgi:hypothetical protein
LWRPTDSDHPASGAALTAKGNLDAERPQERLRAPQAAGKCAGIFEPAGSSPRDAVVVAIGADTQQIGGATGPGAALGHELAHAGGQRVGVDGILDGRPAVDGVSARKRPGGPDRGLARCCSEGKISHSRQSIDAQLWSHAQTMTDASRSVPSRRGRSNSNSTALAPAGAAMQPRALGRKASDEFSVPLCRIHHRLVHRVGNEIAWWKEAGIDPIAVARKLWGLTWRVEGREGAPQLSGAGAQDQKLPPAGGEGTPA